MEDQVLTQCPNSDKLASPSLRIVVLFAFTEASTRISELKQPWRIHFYSKTKLEHKRENYSKLQLITKVL